MNRFLARAAAGALASLVIAGCENTTAGGVTGGSDLQPPRIAISVPGNLNDSINVSSPVDLQITASDNLSLKTLVVQINGGTVPLTFDTTFSTSTPVFNQLMPLPLTGIVAGSQLTIIALAQDGARNFSAPDTLILTAIDPTAPTAVVTEPASNSIVRAGDPVSIGISAKDASGVSRVGYEILQISVTGFETVYSRDSVQLGTAVDSLERIFAAIVPDTLRPATYSVRGFAVDLSGNRGKSPPISIVVQDGVKPGLDLISPPADSNVSLGSDVIPVAHLTDNVGLKRFTMIGIATRGDPNLGVVDTIIRYDSVFAPINISNKPQSFRTGLRDTTVQRLMKPLNPNDPVTEYVFLVARVTDVAGNDSVVVRRFRLVSGPQVTIVRPGSGAVAAPGKSIIVELRAGDKDGVRTLGYRVTGAQFNTTRNAPNPPVALDSLTFVDTLVVPPTLTPPTTFTITPFATDGIGQPGSGASVVVTVPVINTATDVEGPLVYQTLNPRVEVDDSISIRAIDQAGIARVGFTMYDEATGAAIVTRDSVFAGSSFSDLVVNYKLDVPPAYLGMKIFIVSYAYDGVGNVGYSIPKSTTATQGSAALGLPDTTLVVFGRTYGLPQGGTAADIAVDELRNNVFVSNITFDRLEVWEQGTQKFASKKIAVGADPWGLFVANGLDTLLVANSAGTNVSRVFIGSSDLTQVNEVAGRRIKTSETVIYDVAFAIDAAGIARFSVKAYSFSDRPQYIAQANTGDMFYSTKPTPTAPAGTIRRYDPSVPFPESQTLWQYGTIKNSGGTFAVVNADSIRVLVAPSPTISDTLEICDHSYGQNPLSVSNGGTGRCVRSNTPGGLASALSAFNSDVALIGNLDVNSLALTDTTFVAAGGDRRWVAFGEGNTGVAAGRVFMVNALAGIFSPGLLVKDLTDNASESVFGIAINSNSTNVGTHGRESYFSEIESPFHLRLQGKFNTFDVGAGIAFHPDNVGDSAPIDDPARTAFVASANGTIEIVDSFHYTGRGELPVRANLYGPIRVTHAMPGDDPSIILKVFGLTTEGLIVIDVRASDIKPLSAP
jgi:hypothetical protein